VSRPEESTVSTAARLAVVESAYAHLERNYDALNSVVVAQGKLLVRLQKRLEQLDVTLQSQESERGPAHNVSPPHYR